MENCWQWLNVIVPGSGTECLSKRLRSDDRRGVCPWVLPCRWFFQAFDKRFWGLPCEDGNEEVRNT